MRRRPGPPRRRRVTNLTRAISEALARRQVDPDYVPLRTWAESVDAETAERLRFLEVSILPNAGSHALEAAFCGDRDTVPAHRRRVGIVPLLGGLAFHDTDSRRNQKGFPDCPAVVGDTFYLIEMKAEGEVPTAEQQAWLDRMARVKHVVSGYVTPSTWAAFVRFVMERAVEDAREARAETEQ